MKIFWSLLFALCGSSIFAQSFVQSSMISYQQDGRLVKAFVKNEKHQGQADRKRTYYYYHQDKIHHNQGGFTGYLLDGRMEVFDEEQRLIEQGQFKEGLKDGTWKTWYPNGRLQSIRHWKKGEQNGWAETYDEKGELLTQIRFKHNLQ
ncbi:MAG: hypothetical protein AAFP19_18670, partial [Bacteroidota bacterium]